MTSATEKKERYEELVRRHATDLYRFAHRLSDEPDAAEDLVQETFYEAWRANRRLDAVRNPRTWLFGVLRHRYARWARSRDRRPPAVELGTLEREPVASDPGVFARISDQESLGRALGGLRDRYRIPFLLVFQAGYSCQEAADDLGLPLGTVLSRIHRARSALRARLATLDTERSAPVRSKGLPPIRRIGGGA